MKKIILTMFFMSILAFSKDFWELSSFNVNVNDPIEISNKICSVDNQLYETFSRRNIDLVTKYFIWESEVNKIYNAYRKI